MPITSEMLGRYLNPVFVETGSWHGLGIKAALQAGFQKVHSIELSPLLYRECAQTFASDDRVNLWWGDSAEMLKFVLARLKVPATFWLDGHYSGGDTVLGSKHSPLMDELDLIAAHPIKTNTILVDDIRGFYRDDERYRFDRVGIADKLQAINLNYSVSVLAGTDIMVASLPPAQSAPSAPEAPAPGAVPAAPPSPCPSEPAQCGPPPGKTFLP